MKNGALSQTSETVDPRQIREFEEIVGSSLPSEYREFLHSRYEEKPVKKRFVTLDGKIESMVARFFPVSSDGLIGEFKEWTLARQIPAHFLSIAKDPTDNRILLSLSGKDAGAVFYWSLDEEPDPVSCSCAYMRMIAKDFTSFMATLA
jgi:hypothetical protein